MSDPITPSDSQLAIIANNNPYLISALRRLFEKAGAETPSETESIALSAGLAEAKADQALSVLHQILDMLEAVATMPPVRKAEEYQDLAPIYVLSRSDTLADLAPV